MIWWIIIIAIILFVIFNFERIAEICTTIVLGAIVFGALLWLMAGVWYDDEFNKRSIIRPFYYNYSTSFIYSYKCYSKMAK